jgi:hypothetical protein
LVGVGTWSQTGGGGVITFGDVNDPTTTATADAYGTYELTWTIVNGTCMSSNTVSVTYYEQVTVSNQPNQANCNNSTFTMTQSAPSVGTGVWTLISGTATITTPSSPTTTLTGVPVSTSATVRWTVTNGTCSAFDEVTVTNNPLPVITPITGNNILNIGGMSQLASGPGGGTWFSAEPLVATVSVTGLVTGVAPGTSVVSYTVTDGNGCSNSATILISVKAPILDIGIFDASTPLPAGFNKLKVKIKSIEDVMTTNFSSGVFTIRINHDFGVDFTNADIIQKRPLAYGLTKKALNVLDVSDGLRYDYFAFSFVSDSIVNMTAGAPYDVMTLKYRCGAADFQLVTGDVWTNANGGNYYMELGGYNAKRDIYQATASAPTPLSLTETHVNVFCGPTTGSIDLSVTGGTAPYTYLWSNMATDQDISGLTAGTYTVTVTESANGCQSVLSVNILYQPIRNVEDNLNFGTIQAAIDAGTTGNGETLEICAGTYTELVTVSKDLTINGLGNPTVTAPVGTGQKIFNITSNGVTLNGLNIVVNRPNAVAGVYAEQRDNITVQNCTIQSTGSGSTLTTPYGNTDAAGIALLCNGGPIETCNIDNNQITAGAGPSAFSRGIWLREMAATVNANGLTGGAQDLLVQFAAGTATNITGNTFNAAGLDLTEPNATTVTVSGNSFLPAVPIFGQSLLVKHNYFVGGVVVINNNTFTGHGNIGILSGSSHGVTVSNNTFTPAATATNFSHILFSTSYPTGGTPIALADNGISIQGNTFNDNGVAVGRAIDVQNGQSVGSGYGSVLVGSTTANTFAGTLDEYIRLTEGVLAPNYSANPNPAPANVSFTASNNTYSGTLATSMSFAQLFALEDKIFHKIDGKTLGFVTTNGTNAYVTDILAANATATNNDYTRIRNGVEAASNNWTINLKGTFDWTETNAAAKWPLGNDGIVSAADDYSILVPANLNGVTLTAPEGLGNATIQGPGDLAAANLEAVFVFDGGDNKNWIVENLEIKDFDMSIYFGNGAGGSDAFDNLKVRNNKFWIPADLNGTVAPADLNQNIGLHYSFGVNQEISGNTFEVDGTGVGNGPNYPNYSSTVVMQSNTSGGAVYNGLLINNNIIHINGAQNANPADIRGIYENGHAHSSNITVSNNQFVNLGPGNVPASNLQRAFRVTSHSGAGTTVTYSGNTVEGANIGFDWLPGQNFTGQLPVVMTGNTATNCPIGVQVQSNGLATLSGNLFNGTPNNTVDLKVAVGSIVTSAGGNSFAANNYYVENLSSSLISITADIFDESDNYRRSDRIYDALDANTSGLVSFDANDHWVSTPGTGSADETIPNAVSAAAATGDVIHIESGSYASGADASSKDVTFSPGASPACVTLAGNMVLDTDDALAIELSSSTTPCTGFDKFIVNGTVTLNGATLSATRGFSPASGDEFIIIANDGVDAVVGQFVQGGTITISGIVFDINYVGGDGNDVVLTACGAGKVHNGMLAYCTIQDAIDEAAPGATITVDAGVYVENIVVNKALTILGPNSAIDGCGSRGAEAYVFPATNNVTDGVVFNVQSSNVTIKGFTIDGDNTSISGGTNVFGADVNARAGICNGLFNGPYYQIDHLTVQNNIIKDFTSDGVYVENTFGTSRSFNYIKNNKFEKMREGVQTYALHADISNNCMSSVNRGLSIHGTNTASDPLFTAAINDNTIAISWAWVYPGLTRGVGIWVNYRRDNASDLVVNNNTISFPDAIPMGNTAWGIYSLTMDNNRTVTYTNNTVTGSGNCNIGYYTTAVSSTNVKVVGGSMTGIIDYGVLATTNDAVWGAGDAKVTLETVTIAVGGSGVGVKANIDPIAPTKFASINVTTGCNISGGATGILAEGTNASVSVATSKINANGTGIHVKDGAEMTSCLNNFITNNTVDGISIEAAAGAIGPINDNDLSGNTLKAIKNLSAPTIAATCNWYGTVGSGAIAAKITGPVTYSPYRTGGTDDGNPANGFQPADPCAAITNLYVNDNATGGDHYTTAVGNDANPGTAAAPYRTIQFAINSAGVNDMIWTDAGTYVENPIVNKALIIKGSNYGADARAARPFAESVVQTNGNQTAVLNVTASDVTIDGFTLDGDDTGVMGFALASGSDANVSYLVQQMATGNNLNVSNNLMKRAFIGIRGSGHASNGNVFNKNWFDEIGNFDFGYAVSIRDNYYADITNNKMTKVWTGAHINNHNGAGGPVSFNFTGNEVHSYAAGLAYWLNYNLATPLTVNNNQFSAETGAVANNFGIQVVTLQDAVNPTFTNNTITGTDYGIGFQNVPTSAFVTLGGTNTITGTKIAGVLLTDNIANPIGTTNLNLQHAASTVRISGIAITSAAGGAGIKLDGSDPSNTTQTLNFDAATTLNNGAAGLLVNGNHAAISGNTINNLSFVGQTGDYITLSNAALGGLKIDATASLFDGLLGTAALPAPFNIEDKIQHEIDNNALGFVTIKANNAYVTDIAPLAPTAINNDYTRIRNGVEAVSNNWTINLKGTFDWTETNAAAAWPLGNDGIVSAADDYSILVPANLNGVTLTAPEGLGNATIQGPGDLAAANLEAVFVFDGGDNKNWIIENLQIKDFDLSIYFGNGAGGTDAFDNLKVRNNKFWIPADLNGTVAVADPNQNIGLHYSFGVNQEITGNTFEVDGTGVGNGPAYPNYSSTVVMQSNTSGGGVYDGLLIDNNTININGAQNANPADIRGIYENGHAHSSDITVSNNDFVNVGPGNVPASNLQRAFRVTSHSSAGTTVTYSGNTVDGANIGFDWLPGQDFSAQMPIAITGNTVTNCQTGMNVQSKGKATLTNDNFNSNTTGIDINSNSIVSVATSSITANGTGINVKTGGELTSCLNNFIKNNTVDGISIEASAGAIGLINDNDLSGNTLKAIKNLSAPTIAATCNWYGTVASGAIAAKMTGPVTFSPYRTGGTDDGNPANGFQPADPCATVTDFYVNDNVYTMGVDLYTTAVGNDANLGSAAAPFLTIQHAINVVGAGDNIYVDAGSYTEQLQANKSLSIIGADRAGVSMTQIKAPATLSAVVNANAADHHPIIYASGAGNTIDISKVLVDGDGGRSIDRFMGVYYYEANGTFDNARITGIRDVVFSGVQRGLAFVANHAYDANLAQTVTVTNNLIDDYQKGGIVINELNTNGVVTGNTVTGKNTTGVTAQNGIQFGFGSYGTITGNTVTNNLWNSGDPHTFVAAGILLAGVGVDNLNAPTGNVTTISGNNINGNESGLLAGAGGFGYNSNAGVTYGGDVFANNKIHTELYDPSTVPTLLNSYDKRADNPAQTNIVFGSVQYGIDYAGPLSQLNVSAHQFNENVVVNQSVDVRGANYGVAGCSGRGTESHINGIGGTGIAVDFTSDDAKLTGFKLTGVTGVRARSHIGVVVKNNKIDAIAAGIDAGTIVTAGPKTLELSGNCIDLASQAVTPTTPTVGVFLTGVDGDIAPIVSNNTISDAFFGYLLYNVDADVATDIDGGTITGVMQGVSIINIDPVTLMASAPSKAGAKNITMSGFTGSHPSLPNNNFHAGVYTYTGGPVTTASITSTFDNLNISGTGKHSQANAAIYLGDFSDGAVNRQNIIVNECTLWDNLNRGVSIRGKNMLADINRCTLTNNGGDPFGVGGNDGFGIIAREASVVTIDNCYITNPASVMGGYNVAAMAVDPGTSPTASITASSNSLSHGGNLTSKLAINGAGGTFTATCNWWGSAIAANIAPYITGAVTFEPYHTSGADVSGTAGFQPDPLTCNGCTYGVTNVNTSITYCTIQGAIDDAQTLNTHVLSVAAGTYAEQVNVTKDLTIKGPNFGINGNAVRVAEAIIVPPSELNLTPPRESNTTPLVTLSVDGITMDGLKISGDNTAISGYAYAGMNVEAGRGVRSIANEVVFQNNIVEKFTYIGFHSAGGLVSPHYKNIVLTANKFDNIHDLNQLGFGFAMYIQGSAGDITNNTVTNSRAAIQVQPYQVVQGTNGVSDCSNNNFSVWRNGIYYNYAEVGASAWTINQNNITACLPPAAPTGPVLWSGIRAETMRASGNGGTISNNTVNGTGTSVGATWWGIWGMDYRGDASTSTQVFFTSNTVSNVERGFVHSAAADIVLTGNSLSATDKAISIQRQYSSAGVQDPTVGGAFNINATGGNTINGVATGGATLPQLFTIEDAINHKIDNGLHGVVQVISNNLYVTTNSFGSYAAPATTAPAIQRGVDAASTGFTVNVAPGTFTEPAQLNVNENVTILGGGVGVTTVKPAVNTTSGGNLPSESFIYIDPANTVSIKQLTVDCAGKQVNHAIQSRGVLEVDNCAIQNVNYALYAGRGIVFYKNTGNKVTNTTFSGIERIGIHVRGGVETPAPNVMIDSCIYTGKGAGTWLDYGVEFGGGGTGTVTNSVISNCKGLAGDGSIAAGILATTFFGPGTNATITNNKINNNTDGIVVGYDNADVSVVVAHDNDLSGNTSKAIRSVITPEVNATCNWYGFADWGNINPQISGNVDFTPWLTSGGDNLARRGFQPTGLCEGYPVVVTAKVILQGPYDTGTNLMNTAMGAAGIIPTTTPYLPALLNNGVDEFTLVNNSVSEITTQDIIEDNLIVDWVWLELRSTALGAPIATRSALLQSDGDIVDVDGVSPVQFPTTISGDYFLMVRHRNHFGAMSKVVVPDVEGTISFDYRSGTVPNETYGATGFSARKLVEAGVYGLVAGNTNTDTQTDPPLEQWLILYNNEGNDRLPILNRLSGDPLGVLNGYYLEDVNLNGQVKYTGEDNDRVIILNNVGVNTPLNILKQEPNNN